MGKLIRLLRCAAPGFLMSLLAGLGGCTLFVRDTPAPIPTLKVSSGGPNPTSTLVVFLPGRHDRLEDFERNGIADELREAGIAADAVAVDAHLGYYLNRTIVERLEADVLQPARAQGYKRIILVGASLGGLGAIITAREIPGAIDAIVLLGPYLGDEEKLFTAMREAGGPVNWARGRDPFSGGPEEQVWTFLGRNLDTLPPTWLLFGSDDYLAAGHRMLAPLLDADRVREIQGGHDWKTWRELWRGVCRSSDLFAREKSGKQTEVAP